MESQQQDIFDWGVKGIVEGKLSAILSCGQADNGDVMTGFNGTLFCYGQTGSGKTYSKLHGT